MTTTLRREPAPASAPVERIVVGPTLFSATNGPTWRRPRAVALYVFPNDGAARLGSAASPRGILDVVEQGFDRRRPEAVWLRDVPWFVDAWGHRPTGQLERALSGVATRHGSAFVSWLEGHPGHQAGKPADSVAATGGGAGPPRER